MAKPISPNTLLIEDYPLTYSGPKFLTLIEYGTDQYITVVDYVTTSTVSAYVLDMCKSEHIDDVAVVSLIANNWEAYENKPISVLFGMMGIGHHMARIHRTFTLADINRVIGRFPAHDLSASRTVKRRRRRELDKAIAIKMGAYVDLEGNSLEMDEDQAK